MPETVASAWKLVSFIKKTQNVIASHWRKRRVRQSLFLGALALPTSEARTMSKYPCQILAKISLVTPWILNYLKAEICEDGMQDFYDDDDEYHLPERLVEFWDTSDINLMANVVLKFNRL